MNENFFLFFHFTATKKKVSLEIEMASRERDVAKSVIKFINLLKYVYIAAWMKKFCSI